MAVVAFESATRNARLAPKYLQDASGAPRRADPCSTCTIRSLSICAELDAPAQDRLRQLNQTMTLPAHSLLFHEGDEAAHVYTVTSGQMSLSVSMPDGRRQITDFVGPGDFIGLGLDDGERLHDLTAETLTEVHVCRFPREGFARAMEQTPQLGRHVLGFASRRIAAAREQLLLLGRKSAVERVASFLLQAARRNEARGAPASPLSLAMTRGEIADYLGLTLETVSRGFSRLRQLGAIRLDGADRVTLPDMGKLKLLAGGE